MRKRGLGRAFRTVVVGAMVGPVLLFSTAGLRPEAHATTGVIETEATAFQQNMAHDGYQPNETFTFPMQRSWQVDLGGLAGYPIVAGGRVFVLSQRDALSTAYLHAFDVVTGTRLWGPVGVADADYAKISYADGRLFVHNSDFVRAIDPVTGAVLWARGTSLSGVISSDGWSGALAIGLLEVSVLDGVVYAASAAHVLALDEADGHLLWRKRAADHNALAVWDGSLFTSQPGRLSPVDVTSQWPDFTNGIPSPAAAAAVADGLVFARPASPWSDSGQIRDAASGALVRTFAPLTAPAVDGTSAYYLINTVRADLTSERLLVAEDSRTGTRHWSFAGDGNLGTAALVVGDHVFVGSESGELYAVSAQTGVVDWTTQVGAPLTSKPGFGLLGASWDLTSVSFAAAEGRLFVPAGMTLSVYADDNTPQRTAIEPPAPITLTVPPTFGSGNSVSKQVDAARDGAVAGDDTQAPVRRQWSWNLGGIVGYPLVVGNRVYATASKSGGASVYAFDAGTGRLIWARRMDSVAAQLAYDRGRVFVVVGKDIVALDALTGVRLWRRTGGIGNASPSVFAGGLYAPSSPRYPGDRLDGISRYNETTGAQTWRVFPLGGGTWAGPAIGAGKLFVNNFVNQAAAFNLRTGATAWDYRTGDTAWASMPTYVNKRVIIRPGSRGTANIVSPDASPMSGVATLLSPAGVGDVLWLTQKSGMAAWDMNSGRQAWQYSDPTIITPPIYSNGNVYVGTSDSRLLVLNALTGQQVWQGTLSAPMWPNPATAPDTDLALAVGHGVVAVPAGNRLDVFSDSRYLRPTCTTSGIC